MTCRRWSCLDPPAAGREEWRLLLDAAGLPRACACDRCRRNLDPLGGRYFGLSGKRRGEPKSPRIEVEDMDPPPHHEIPELPV